MIEGSRGFLKARYGGERKAKELEKRKATFKDLKVHVVPGAGHYPHIDHAPQVASLVSHFIRNSLSPSPSPSSASLPQ